MRRGRLLAEKERQVDNPMGTRYVDGLITEVDAAVAALAGDGETPQPEG